MRTVTIAVDGRPWTVTVPDLYTPLFNSMRATVVVPSAAGSQTLRAVLSSAGRTITETRLTSNGKATFQLAAMTQALFDRPTFVSDQGDESIATGIEQNYTLRILRKVSNDSWADVTSQSFYASYGSLQAKENVPYCRLYRNFPSYLLLGFTPQGESQAVYYVNGQVVGEADGDFGHLYMTRKATSDLLPDMSFKDFVVTNQHDEVLAEGEVDCVAFDTKHICLRFINRYGCPQTAVLQVSESGSQADTLSTYTRRAADYDEREANAYGVYEAQTHAQRRETRSVTCGVQGVSEREVERLRDLYLSAHVEMWLGGNEWQEVVLADGGMAVSASRAPKLHDVAITFSVEGRQGQW